MAYAPRAGDRMRGTDDQSLSVQRKTLDGGQNTRIDPSLILENQATVIYNADLGVAGKTDKRPGITMIADDAGTRTMALLGYTPTSTSARLYRVEGTNIRKWTGSGNWSASLGTVTTGLDTSLIQGGESGENEVVFLQNGTDNPQRINSSDTFQDLGAGATSPAKTPIQIFWRNRWWLLLNGFLYYSDAYSADYSSAFSGSNGFRFSGYGADKGLSAIRDQGLFIFMQNGIWALNPSATPAATDTPELITSDHGAIEWKCITQVGDDILYLSPSGIRSLKRTIQDKVQLGTSYPLSYYLKDEFDNINWSVSSKFHSHFWQDKYFFFFAQTPATDINRCLVYWPALDPDKVGKSWMVLTGWTITSAAKFFVNGQEFFYGGSTDGKVYKLWSGYDDDGTAINLQIETRDEDMGVPQVSKFGGELELVAEAAGDYDITVSASIDGGSYTVLGTMSLASDAPSLPINLPFSLASAVRVHKKFHLDDLGEWKRIRFKFQHNATNGSDQIRILEYNIVTYRNEYDSESR